MFAQARKMPILRTWLSCLLLVLIPTKYVLGEEKAADLLEQIYRLQSKNVRERVSACQAIGRKAEAAAPAIDELVLLLADKHEIELDQNTVVDGYTLDSVNDGPGKIAVACFAAEALAAIGPKAKNALPHLVDLLQDKDHLTRVNAIKAINGICTEDNLEIRMAVEKALKDAAPLVRRYAATVLGKLLKSTNDIPKGLNDLLKDEDEYVRRRACGAIERIKEKDTSSGKTTESDASPKEPSAIKPVKDAP